MTKSSVPISVFTGSRAEYGLLKHLISLIDSDPLFRLQLIVSGSHLRKIHGYTVKEIQGDGYLDVSLIPLSLDSPVSKNMALLTSEAMEGVSLALGKLAPKLLFLLGDRYETFAAASSAHLLGIPIAHIHGGESTKGAVDDRLRHAITQLSSWHFTAAECYYDRVIRMGHPSERVFVSGPLVIDGLLASPTLSRASFEEATGFQFGPRNLLVTYHPETLLEDSGIKGFEILLSQLAKRNCHVLFTHPNADAGGTLLLSMLKTFAEAHSGRCWEIPSLGHEMYLAALKLFEAMAGNSSSGLIEAPLLDLPVLNIGSRQAGRLRSGNVLDVPPQEKAISLGLDKVLSDGCCSSWPRPLKTSLMKSPSQYILKWLLAQSTIGFG